MLCAWEQTALREPWGLRLLLQPAQAPAPQWPADSAKQTPCPPLYLPLPPHLPAGQRAVCLRAAAAAGRARHSGALPALPLALPLMDPHLKAAWGRQARPVSHSPLDNVHREAPGSASLVFISSVCFYLVCAAELRRGPRGRSFQHLDRQRLQPPSPQVLSVSSGERAPRSAPAAPVLTRLLHTFWSP